MAKGEDKVVVDRPSIGIDMILDNLNISYTQEGIIVDMMGRLSVKNLPTVTNTLPVIKIQIIETFEDMAEITKYFKEKFDYSVHRAEEVAKKFNNEKETK